MMNKFSMLPMQLYYDCPDKNNKNIEIIRHDELNYIASEKYDGEASMFIKINGEILIRSRNLSKVTGKYGDYTSKLPHLVKELENIPDNTVFLAELCLNDGTNHAKRGTMSTDVGTVLRSLPPLAIKKQDENGKIVAVVYDCLMYAGNEIMNCPYKDRVKIIEEMFDNEYNNLGYIYHTQFKYNNFYDFFNEIIKNSGEGIVLVKKDYPYSPGKRTAWKTLKWKRHTETYDLLIVDTEDYTKEYTGKQLNKWQYFVDENNNKVKGNYMSGYTPVTKGWFYGWKAAVICMFNDKKIRVSSGLSDEDREQLSTEVMQEHIKNNELYAEVSGMQSASRGKLRHPIINRLRLL